MKEVLIAFILALFVGATMNGLSQLGPGSQAAQPPATTSGSETTAAPLDAQSVDDLEGPETAAGTVTETNQDKFNTEVLQSTQPALVDFYADWCGPCKQMSPIIEKLAGQYDGRVHVFKVNIDKNPQLVAKYGIQSIPTFMIFKKGAATDTFAGSMPRAELAAALDRQL